MAGPRVRCDCCGHFVPLRGDSDDAPGRYNPCARGHTMRFRMPKGHPDTDPDWGFERAGCADLIPMPAPRPRPWPPAPRPRTRPVLAWVRPWTPARG